MSRLTSMSSALLLSALLLTTYAATLQADGGTDEVEVQLFLVSTNSDCTTLERNCTFISPYDDRTRMSIGCANEAVCNLINQYLDVRVCHEVMAQNIQGYYIFSAQDFEASHGQDSLCCKLLHEDSRREQERKQKRDQELISHVTESHFSFDTGDTFSRLLILAEQSNIITAWLTLIAIILIVITIILIVGVAGSITQYVLHLMCSIPNLPMLINDVLGMIRTFINHACMLVKEMPCMMLHVMRRRDVLVLQHHHEPIAHESAEPVLLQGLPIPAPPETCQALIKSTSERCYRPARDYNHAKQAWICGHRRWKHTKDATEFDVAAD